MTTPAPELPKHYLERCAVCGEPTKNRCSACFQAGMPLFFCSAEHQNLVWPEHKSICGKNARSPYAPPLTPESAASFLRVSTQLVEFTSHVKLECAEIWQALLGEYLPPANSPQEMLVNALPWLSKPQRSVKQEIALDVALALTYRGEVARKALIDEQTLPFNTLDPWHHVKFLEIQLGTVLPEGIDGGGLSVETSRFRHHALILVSLLRRKANDPSTIPLGCIHGAFELLVNSANDAIVFDFSRDGQKAQKLVEALLRPVKNFVPIRCEWEFAPDESKVLRVKCSTP